MKDKIVEFHENLYRLPNREAWHTLPATGVYEQRPTRPSTMSSTPQDNAGAYQFQFKHQYPMNYPMSQAQQQYQAQQVQQGAQSTAPIPQASTSQSVAGPSNANSSQGATQTDTSSQQTQTQTRMEAERARKDRTMVEFLLMLREYKPVVSDNLDGGE